MSAPSARSVIEDLLNRLARNAEERRFLEGQLLAARAFYEGGKKASDALAMIAERPAPPVRSVEPTDQAARFPVKTGGPQETILAIVEQQPGIPKAEARRLGRLTVVTDAKDKSRSVEEAVRRLLADEKIVERNGGLFLPTT